MYHVRKCFMTIACASNNILSHRKEPLHWLEPYHCLIPRSRIYQTNQAVTFHDVKIAWFILEWKRGLWQEFMPVSGCFLAYHCCKFVHLVPTQSQNHIKVNSKEIRVYFIWQMFEVLLTCIKSLSNKSLYKTVVQSDFLSVRHANLWFYISLCPLIQGITHLVIESGQQRINHVRISSQCIMQLPVSSYWCTKWLYHLIWSVFEPKTLDLILKTWIKSVFLDGHVLLSFSSHTF